MRQQKLSSAVTQGRKVCSSLCLFHVQKGALSFEKFPSLTFEEEGPGDFLEGMKGSLKKGGILRYSQNYL